MGPPCSQLVPSHRGSTANKLYLRCIVVRQSLGKVCCRNFVFGRELTYDADLWGSCWHVWHQERHPGLDRHVTHSRSNLEGSWQWGEMPITTMRCDAFKSFSRLLFSLPNFRGQIAVAVASASRRNQASQGNSRAQGEHGQRSWFRSRTADCCLRRLMAAWSGVENSNTQTRHQLLLPSKQSQTIMSAKSKPKRSLLKCLEVEPCCTSSHDSSPPVVR